MNAEEQSALDSMKSAIQKEKDNFFSILKMLNDASTDTLASCGYGGTSNAIAMQKAFVSYSKRIKAHQDRYLKLYPDD